MLKIVKLLKLDTSYRTSRISGVLYLVRELCTILGSKMCKSLECTNAIIMEISWNLMRISWNLTNVMECANAIIKYLDETKLFYFKAFYIFSAISFRRIYIIVN